MPEQPQDRRQLLTPGAIDMKRLKTLVATLALAAASPFAAAIEIIVPA